MFASTLYKLNITQNAEMNAFGNPFVSYHYHLEVDSRILCDGVAYSPDQLGEAIGDALRNLASISAPATTLLK